MRRMVTMWAALVVAMAAAGALYASFDTGDGERDRAAARAEAAVEKEQDLYDEATDALDEHEWRRAAQMFARVAQMKMSHADAAMYWRAYALSRMGTRSEALSAIVELQTAYPKSRWAEDAKALEVEIRQAAGQTIEPGRVDDEELKLLALNGLLSSDPEGAWPVIESILSSKNHTIKVKKKALFVIAQSGSPRAMEILGRAARDGSNPDLRGSAIKYLGIAGGETARKTLFDVYRSSADPAVKKSILRSFMVSGDRVRLVDIARTEQSDELRSDAVRQLGIVGARDELSQLYASEKSTAIRKSIIQAMFLGGNAEKLGEIARGEKDLDLRMTAIKNLGMLGGGRTGELLTSLYDTNSDRGVRETIIKSLFIQGNAHALVGLARKEKDPELKKEIVSKLALTRSKEAADYLMEFLKE